MGCITIFGGQTIDNQVFTSNIASEAKREIYSQKNYIPRFMDFEGTEILCQYNGDTVSTHVSGLVNPLTGYIVYRWKTGEGSSDYVQEVPRSQRILYDYMVRSRNEYQWSVVPTTATEIGTFLLSDKLRTNFNSWYITSIAPHETGKGYKPVETWRLSLDIEAKDLKQNIDKTKIENLTRYPKTQIGQKNYFSSSVSCLIRDMDLCSEEKNDEEFSKMERWNAFVASGLDCILKDTSGHLFRCQIEDNVNYVLDKTLEQPLGISFSYYEVGDVEDLIVQSGEAK